MAFEAMFQPIQIGKLTIRNRVLSTAHAEVYATDGGMTTDRYVKYYEEKSQGRYRPGDLRRFLGGCHRQPPGTGGAR